MDKYLLPTLTDVPETIILADGDFPVHPLVVALLDACPYVVCCDGAANRYIRSGRMPVAIVGDGDSLLPEVREQYGSLIHSEAEQDTNDLSKAFRFCLSQGRRDILILGATGKREDHTLGNISLLMDYMDLATVSMLTNYGVFTPVKGNAEFQSYPGEQVSVFNMGGCTSLSARGLIYPLSVFTNWWQGTLNEAAGGNFTILTDGKILVFRTYIP